ncbi:hypothetical protein [Pelagicoccus mobilis]|uniref:Uncharacterized protein n=1 Tax=Pelagicoccus mobilis TaxID=415221 RepID=A0A934RWZ0_9BACT|nr:hypothetical protein [Pelagicoccus mobilis]MBK1878051.1 hypothetical protein [Pelagicoccus mobilis]
MAKQDVSLNARLSAGILKARRVFFKLSMREKGLALLFVLALVFIWFSWQMDRHSALGAKHDNVRRTEQMQELELSEGPNIRSTYQDQISAIDLASLPSRDEVRAQVDALVRRSGFSSFDLGEARTEAGADLNFHTFQLVVQKSTYQKIKSFTQTIKTELPFLSLERIVIQAQARDDNFLDVRYVFKSIEYTK